MIESSKMLHDIREILISNEKSYLNDCHYNYFSSAIKGSI